MSLLRNATQAGITNYNIVDVEIDTDYNFGDGNHNILASGSKTNIKTDNGDSTIKVIGNESNITTGKGNNNITSYGSNSTIQTGEGNQKIISVGDNKTIYTDNGDDEIIFIGDGNTLDAGNGENSVVFWGNDTTIKTGSGNDDIKTYDQVYTDDDFSLAGQAFLSSLPTGIWEDWNRIDRYQLDYICKKSLMSKSQTWVYEDTFDVTTYFSRYINGLKNVNIDMGEGSNTASLTVDKASANIVDNGKTITKSGSSTVEKSDNITFNEDDSLDYELANRKDTKIDVKTKSNTRWGGVFVAAAAAVAAVVLTVISCGTLAAPCAAAFSSAAGAVGAGAATAAAAGTAGAVVGATATGIGAAMGGLALAQSGYNICKGQAHSGDWVNAITAPLMMTGYAPATASLIRGGYAFSQKDYISAATNFAGAASAIGAGTGVSGTQDALTTTGYTLKTIDTAANAVNVVDKTIKVSKGDNNAFELLDLALSTINLGTSINDLTTAKPAPAQPAGGADAAKEDPSFLSKTLDYMGDEFKDVISAPGKLIMSGTSALGEAIGENKFGKAVTETGNALAAPFVAAGNAANNIMDGLANPEAAIKNISKSFMDGSGFGKTSPKAPEKPKSNIVSDSIESGTDIAGDVAGGIISVPSKIIGGVTSVLGNNLFGTDNWIGNGTIWLGQKINNNGSWLGDGIDTCIDTTGSIIAHPIDSYDSAKKYVSEKIDGSLSQTNDDDVIIEYNFTPPTNDVPSIAKYQWDNYRNFALEHPQEYVDWCATQKTLPVKAQNILKEVKAKLKK